MSADKNNGTFPLKFLNGQEREECGDNQPLRCSQTICIIPDADPTVEYIELGEEYKLKIFGYQKNNLYACFTWILIFASCGILGLFCYWFPRLLLYGTHIRCPLEIASKVLIEERYKDHRSRYHVKKVIVLNYKSVLEHGDEINGWDYQDLAQLKNTEKAKFSVHMAGGVFRKTDTIRFFNCRKIRFIWDESQNQFCKLTGLDNEIPVSYFHQQSGLSSLEQYVRRSVYGNNEITVPVKTFFMLLFMEILNPFYVFQFMSFILWYFDDYILYASTIFLITCIGIVSSCVSTYMNQKTLHKRVSASDEVQIIQGSEQVTILTEQLVPGDILVLPTEGGIMYCDAILLNGSCIMNESALTGESDPIMKTPIPNADVFYDDKEHSRHTLYCGTEILQTRFYGDEHVLALVIRTGFFTVKGSVIRGLLYPIPADYKFEKHSYKFLQVLALIAGIGFLYTVITKILRGVPLSGIALQALDLITVVVPPALPAAMTIGAVHALLRLKAKKVYCISPRAINVSGSSNCVCFDKTGTLTEEGLDMWGVIPINNGKFIPFVKEINDLNSENNLLHAMVTCHTLTIIRKELCGDPMDLKIFKSTSWVLEEPTTNDDSKYDLIIPTVVRPPGDATNDSTLELGKEIGIVRHFTFSSSLQRMTVITRVLGASHYSVYCKGAPENICNLCLPESVPTDFNKVLKFYTRKGYRVIAAAHRSLPASINYTKMQRLSREEVESDLIMLGLIILENKLKPETAPVISVLKKANIRTVIVTGDNMLTAVSVARDCGMITPDQDVITIQYVEAPVPRVFYTLADVSPASSVVLSPTHYGDSLDDVYEVDELDNSAINNYNGYVSNNCALLSSDKSVSIPRKYVFAITGACWSFLRQHFPDLLPVVGVKGAIFSRMNPDQKQNLIQELQDLGYVVAMCGDGANDCGALKAAHTGISLSSNESSSASQFTSQRQDIRCVVDVIRECRAALVISFTIFKFMASYSLTQFISIIILYSIDTNLTDAQFLYIDLFVIAFCALSLGHTPPFEGELAKNPPPSSLVSVAPIVSLLCQMLITAIMQLTSFFAVQSYSWFEPYNATAATDNESYENYAVFSLSVLQYVILAISFHKGPPYVGYICSNYFLVACLVTVSSVTFYIILSPMKWLQKQMELKIPPDMQFRIVIVILASINLVLSFIVEFVLCDYVISKLIKNRLKNSKWAKRYTLIERELLSLENWPKITRESEFLQHKERAQKVQTPRKRCSTFSTTVESSVPSCAGWPLKFKESGTASVPDVNDCDNGTIAGGSVYTSMNGIHTDYRSSQNTLHSEYFTPADSYDFLHFVS